VSTSICACVVEQVTQHVEPAVGHLLAGARRMSRRSPFGGSVICGLVLAHLSSTRHRSLTCCTQQTCLLRCGGLCLARVCGVLGREVLSAEHGCELTAVEDVTARVVVAADEHLVQCVYVVLDVTCSAHHTRDNELHVPPLACCCQSCPPACSARASAMLMSAKLVLAAKESRHVWAIGKNAEYVGAFRTHPVASCCWWMPG
jgi:hypothetical protein